MEVTFQHCWVVLLFTDAANSIFSFPFIVPSKHWHWWFCSVCHGRWVNQKTRKGPPAQMFPSIFWHFTRTFMTSNYCPNWLFVRQRQTCIVCICQPFPRHKSQQRYFTLFVGPTPYKFATGPPLNTGHKLAPARGSAAEGWENCTYFVFVPSALHRQQKRHHTIWWFDRISSVADDGATTMHQQQQQQQQQQHRLSLGRNYPGGGQQCQQRWRSPAVRWCCGRCCCAAVVPSGHTSHSGHVGTCPRTASREGHWQHSIAGYLHKIDIYMTTMLLKLEHTKVLAKWTWTFWSISRSRSTR